MAHPLVLQIRHMFVAPPGKTLAIADSSQIEARVLAWIAGQWNLVEKFGNGEEIYCGFASKVLGRPIRKARKTDIPAIAARLTWARNSIGKVGILGCGYGMGPDKAEDYAGGAIDFPTAQKIVQTYRAENAEIVKFWREIEKCFVYTSKYGRPTQMARGLRFDKAEDCDLIITLPNTRELKYHNVRLDEGQYGETIAVFNQIERKWEHTWGGSLTENVVQAMSRDILTEAMLRAEARGVHTALSVHDELVAVAAAPFGKEALTILIEELSRRPSWAPECPLGAEGHVNQRYVKP